MEDKRGNVWQRGHNSDDDNRNEYVHDEVKITKTPIISSPILKRGKANADGYSDDNNNIINNNNNKTKLRQIFLTIIRWWWRWQ